MYDVYVSMRHTPLSAYYAACIEKSMGPSVRLYNGFDRIRDGEFPAELVMRIHRCKNFIVILTPETFGQADDNTSWMAYEVEIAVEEHKNIILLMTDDFIWPKEIPSRVAALRNIYGITIHHASFRFFSNTSREIRSLLVASDRDEAYDVFISFKSEDSQLAETIYNYCKHMRKNPFWSKRTLPELSQSEYEDAIYNALRKAKHFIVVLSNLEHLQSNWVQREMKAFDRAITEGRKPNGNFVFIATDDVYEQIINCNKMCLDERYCGYQILKISNFDETLLYYLS